MSALDMGVDSSEAYDGKVGETFEMKTMLHRVHSAGTEGVPPYVIYRNRGIYAWATDDSLLPNWPGTGSQIVFGSDQCHAKPQLPHSDLPAEPERVHGLPRFGSERAA